MMEIKLVKNILDANDRLAEDNKKAFEAAGTTVINMIGSPGSGKTSLILRTIEKLKDKCGIQVIEGDIASSIDAQTIAGKGIDALQINTEGECHLDANMIRQAVRSFELKPGLLFIENVGNLVCPAEFEIGEDFKVTVLSVPEGHDKPYKYPLVFSKSTAVVLTKCDLMPYIDFEMDTFISGIRSLNPNCRLFVVSSKTGEGIDEWASWLEGLRRR